MAEEKGTRIEVESGVSLFDGKPFVTLVVGDRREQMRPSKAREIAAMLYECAEASVQDAAISDFGRRELGGVEGGARLVAMVRSHRERFDAMEE